MPSGNKYLYLNQGWPRSVSPYSVTGPLCVKLVQKTFYFFVCVTYCFPMYHSSEWIKTCLFRMQSPIVQILWLKGFEFAPLEVLKSMTISMCSERSYVVVTVQKKSLTFWEYNTCNCIMLVHQSWKHSKRYQYSNVWLNVRQFLSPSTIMLFQHIYSLKSTYAFVVIPLFWLYITARYVIRNYNSCHIPLLCNTRVPLSIWYVTPWNFHLNKLYAPFRYLPLI